MVHKQANICDGCHKRIAEKKCCLCGNDLCSYCKRSSFELTIRSIEITQIIGEIVFCRGCKRKLIEKLGSKTVFDEDFNKDIISKMGGYLVKKILVESL